MSTTPKEKYNIQKYRAMQRNVEWELTYEQWWDWWQATGKWEQRGFGPDRYCMCRTNDKGAYALGNIYCDTTMGNFNERNKRISLPVNTPLGVFGSIREAARAHNVYDTTIKYWITAKKQGFSLA